MCNHAVQFYEDDGFLVRKLYGHIHAGLTAGRACLVIATAAHREALGGLLRVQGGHDVEALAASGFYLALDAAKMLETFMVDDSPDEARFGEILQEMLLLLPAEASGPVAAFGEMVALLYAAGKMDAAVRLEQLWSRFAPCHRLDVLCAYPLSLFHRPGHAGHFERICHAHDQVFPTESLADLQGEAWHRSAASLQQQALALKSTVMEHMDLSMVSQVAAVVYQHSEDALMVCDSVFRIISINPAFSRITGYAGDEVLNRAAGTIFKQTGVGPGVQFYQAFSASTGAWKGELVGHRKDGGAFTALVNINALRDESGRNSRFVILFADVAGKKSTDALLWRQANFDPLTNLPNRRLLRDRMEQEIRKARREGTQFALMLVDMDHFKDINDALGHEFGDRLLMEAGLRIKACVRESDTVARMGGDEFAVILSGVGQMAQVNALAQKILLQLMQPFSQQDESLFLSASIGIALFPGDSDSPDGLLKGADQAMYAAKKDGRNGFGYFHQDMQLHALAHLRMQNDLHLALGRGQFRVYFQPIVELATGRVLKAEALMRWLHPQRGMVPPAEFIPVAETSGVIKQMGDWVFREAAQWAQRWSAWCGETFQISVNRSPAQFMSDDFTGDWSDCLGGLELPGCAIAVEITEGLLLNMTPKVQQQLAGMRAAGIEFSIDDFGTGYSSLAYLQKLDVDFLKIDQSFVRDMTVSARSLAIVEAIIVLGHKLGVRVIAEGVETVAQRNLLYEAGCDYAQGYLFSPAVPPEEFEYFLRKGGEGRPECGGGVHQAANGGGRRAQGGS